MAAEGADERKSRDKETMPPWHMPQLYESGLDFWNTHYPLRIMNSLTRKKVSAGARVTPTKPLPAGAPGPRPSAGCGVRARASVVLCPRGLCSCGTAAGCRL